MKKTFRFLIPVICIIAMLASGCSELDYQGYVTDNFVSIEESLDDVLEESLEDTAPDTLNEEEPKKKNNKKEKKIKLSDIQEYNGKPYVALNNNVPNFTSKELTTKAYEKYSALDSLGRCGVAIASCGTEIMPKANEERGSISSIKPSGWVQKKYKGVSGGYLWNRCHLIGWQLSAENANRSNLITGTRYMNVEGMLPFENMVADYIRETDNHVAYRVTPHYKGNNLVCTGVQIEAYSVEDEGEGICFNVFCYNVQPNIKINYKTGNSSGPKAQDTSNKKENHSDKHSSNEMVWIPRTGSKYHNDENCSGMKNPSKVSKEDAEDAGYEPCKKCY